MSDVIRDFLQTLFTVLLVMDPIGIIPQFLALTGKLDRRERDKIIVNAVLIGAVVVLVFLLAGRFLLEFFGIKPGAFYISGGILFFFIAYEMITSRPGLRATPDDSEGGSASIALFPLAIPMIAGPGLLTVIMIHTSSKHNWFYSVGMMFPSLVIGLAATYASLKASEFIHRILGTTGIFILEKIMGLVLSGFAVQFVYNGLAALEIIG